MRRCIAPTLLSSSRVRTVRVRPRCSIIELRSCRTSHISASSELATPPILPIRYRRYAVFNKLSPPSDGADPNAWIGLLEHALPPHLRQNGQDSQPATLSAEDVADILLAAQYPGGSLPARYSIDLLSHLGIAQGRWSATVWLIKKVVEHFPIPRPRSQRLEGLTAHWAGVTSLHEATTKGINLVPHLDRPTPSVSEIRSLDALTLGDAQYLGREETLHHDALGQVWRSLGAMTQACVGGDIKAEVLEIIAYLHHKEIMPQSIYQYNPATDSLAIQQPPFLPLLSSRILTSLSDAAWRAHEKLVIDEARARGGQYAEPRPEIPGAVYRVSVAGLLPEVWLELILWSCLHGGWILQGAEILHDVCRTGSNAETRWKPMSWREHERLLHPPDQGGQAWDWNYWDHLFKTTSASTRDEAPGVTVPVRRTVSSEVVNAYIDTLVSGVNVNAEAGIADMRFVLQRLHAFNNFLKRANLGLSTGSWDALLLRMIDDSPFDIAGHAALLKSCIDLSPRPGDKLKATNLRDFPAYALDGNAALQGLLLRSLRSRIASGSLPGALAAFQALQIRVDTDRRHSLEAFFHRLMASKELGKQEEPGDMFTAHLPGIDCTSVHLNIPPTILGPFLDLVTEAKQYEFGQWMLYNPDVDGPIIPPSLYGDWHLQPALFRFAIESNDNHLLQQLQSNARITQQTYRAMLDLQIEHRRWDAVVRVLDYFSHTPHLKWSITNLANLIRSMLLLQGEIRAGKSPDGESDLEKATEILTSMALGHSTQVDREDPPRAMYLTSLVCAFAAVDTQWAEICWNLRPIYRPHRLLLKAQTFNRLLDGTVSTYGSERGRRLLELMWPPSARAKVQHHRMAGDRPSVLDSEERHRIAIKVPNQRADGMVLLGVMSPNLATFLTILRQALTEQSRNSPLLAPDRLGTARDTPPPESTRRLLRQEPSDDYSARGTMIWALRCTLELCGADAVIVDQLRGMLGEHGLDDFGAELHAFAQELEGPTSRYTPDWT